MDDVLAAFRHRLAAVVDAAVAGNDAIETAHARFRPTPLLSVVIEGCIGSGRDVTDGGACHNSTGMQGVGLADVADSLAAIEQFVFVERRLGMDELLARSTPISSGTNRCGSGCSPGSPIRGRRRSRRTLGSGGGAHVRGTRAPPHQPARWAVRAGLSGR